MIFIAIQNVKIQYLLIYAKLYFEATVESCIILIKFQHFMLSAIQDLKNLYFNLTFTSLVKLLLVILLLYTKHMKHITFFT